MVKTTVKTTEELKQKAEKALTDPKLVDFAKTAPLNKDGRVNLNWAYEQAFQYVYEQTKDLPKAKELAVATRWLTMLRRDYKEEFEKLVIQKEQPELKYDEQFLQVNGIEFKLPVLSQISTQCVNDCVTGFEIKQMVRFFRLFEMERFCAELLEKLANIEKSMWGDLSSDKIRDAAINYLEEKFSLKIRICENCKYFLGTSHYSGLKKTTHANIKISDPIPEIRCSEYPGEKLDITVLFTGCKYWSHKEVLEKKEN